MLRLRGLGVAPGVAVGRAIVLKQHARDLRLRLPAAAVARELDRLARARERSHAQLEDIKARVARLAGPEHAYLFDAQLLMLDDPMLLGRAEQLVRAERINAEWAVRRAFEELAAILDQAEDPYLRDRKGDIGDVVGRLRLNLRGPGAAGELLKDLDEPCVLVADDLPPSIAAQVDWGRVLGFATDAGSWTYHTAILARSLGVPGVVALGDVSARVQPGVAVALDGGAGELVVDPDAATLRELEERRARAAAGAPGAPQQVGPTMTADGVRIRLDANIELPGEVADARAAAAEGIGLYRSEFLVSRQHTDALAEDAQYRVYRRLLEEMAPATVTVRMFDPGAAQVKTDLDAAGAPIPLHGLRALRLNPAWRGVVRTQVRALVRAAPHGRLRIIVPFVSSVEEFRDARGLVLEAVAALGAASSEAPVPLGAMIEVPSAALTADLLAREADFLSIGTNDLIQYVLAIERGDARQASLYDPLHPAVVRLVRQALRGAERGGRSIAVCGEMAADPAGIALLVGLGARELSMAPAAIPRARRIIAELRVEHARRVAARALRGTAGETLRHELAALVAHPRSSSAVHQ